MEESLSAADKVKIGIMKILDSTSSSSNESKADDSVIIDERPAIVKILYPEKSKSRKTSCNLDISKLRVSDEAANASIVSEGNLSDVMNQVDEYPENESRKSEKILEQLDNTANPEDLSLGDPNLERLLDAPDDDTPPLTSTPAASPNRPSDIVEEDANDSMPSLESVTDHEVDSGNSSGDELVKTNFESDLKNSIYYFIHDYIFRLNFHRPLLRRKTLERSRSSYDDVRQNHDYPFYTIFIYSIYLFLSLFPDERVQCVLVNR